MLSFCKKKKHDQRVRDGLRQKSPRAMWKGPMGMDPKTDHEAKGFQAMSAGAAE